MRIYTGGTFDLFHEGHVHFLEQCKRLAGPSGEVVVSLNTDEFVEKFKGMRPMYSYEARKAILKSCKYVDRVVENTGGADSIPAIQNVNPDLIVIGSDWAKKDYYAQMGFTQQWLDKHNVGLVYVPYTEGVSTTGIKDNLRRTELSDECTCSNCTCKGK